MVYEIYLLTLLNLFYLTGKLCHDPLLYIGTFVKVIQYCKNHG